jgi:hypothetical protein
VNAGKAPFHFEIDWIRGYLLKVGDCPRMDPTLAGYDLNQKGGVFAAFFANHYLPSV